MLASYDECSGCGACYAACPNNCISMQENNEGFLFPRIDEEHCIHCKRCEVVCPINTPVKTNGDGKAYLAYNTSINQRLQASSGGIFIALAENVLDKNGLVYGAKLDCVSQTLQHVRISSKKDIEKITGSKYLQSDIHLVYREIETLLKNDRYVLFCGTPCQIAGLMSYLKENQEKLLCVDLICHGVPSGKVFRKYVKSLEEKYRAKLVEISFRDKKNGWEDASVKAIFENGKVYMKSNRRDYYMRAFIENYTLRLSCYNCKFKSVNGHSDITLGDFWGIGNKLPRDEREKGVSAVIINSLKGEEIWKELQVANKIVFRDAEIEEIVKSNSMIIKPPDKPEGRANFFAELDALDFMQVAYKNITSLHMIYRIKCFIKRLFI